MCLEYKIGTKQQGVNVWGFKTSIEVNSEDVTFAAKHWGQNGLVFKSVNL